MNEVKRKQPGTACLRLLEWTPGHEPASSRQGVRWRAHSGKGEQWVKALKSGRMVKELQEDMMGSKAREVGRGCHVPSGESMLTL